MPAGIFTVAVCAFFFFPFPRQSGHFSSIREPRPEHWGHVRASVKKPWLNRTCPVPRHPEHTFGLVPTFAPFPEHVSQVNSFSKVILRSTPKAASSKVI